MWLKVVEVPGMHCLSVEKGGACGCHLLKVLGYTACQLRRVRRAGLLAEYVNEVRVAMDLDVIVKCRMSGDYSLGMSAEGGASRKLKKAWRIYRCVLALLWWNLMIVRTVRF